MVGVGEPAPLNSISPCFFTTSAAWGFKIGLAYSPTNWAGLLTRTPFAAGNVRPSASVPCGRRDLFTTGPGPDAGGSKPGKEGWAHMPEKSGMAAGPTTGAAVCPKAVVATATANITSKPKSRCLCMTTSLSWLVGAMVRNGVRTSDEAADHCGCSQALPADSTLAARHLCEVAGTSPLAARGQNATPFSSACESHRNDRI